MDSTLFHYGLLLLELDKPMEAEVLFRDCLRIRKSSMANSWSTFNARAMIGRALLAQGDYANAEAELLAGFQGMKQREDSMPKPGIIRVVEVLDALIELYTAIEKPDEVKKWQAERADFSDAAPPQKQE